jgi:hypothetical protein
MATSLLTIACFFASRRAPTAIVTDKTVGIATGIAAIDTKSDDHRHHGQRQHDQVVADLQHGFLEMADGDRRLHQFRRLAEIGFAARRVDQSANLAAADD